MSRLRPLLVCLVVALTSARAVAAEPARSIAVTETRPLGVRPEAALLVTRQLYATVARLGWRAMAEQRTSAASAGLDVVTPTALLEVARRSQSDHALGATLGSRDGRYVVTLTLADADLSGPFFRSAEATPEALEATVDGLLRDLLSAAPPPAARGETSSPPRAEPPPRDADRVSLALQTEGALGLHRRGFYNHLAGARLDYAFGDGFTLGAYAGYLNAQGKDGRVSNLLTYVQLEYRVTPAASFWVPVRFGTGYLPANGPVLRFAAGLGFPLGDGLRFTLDALAPTLWIVRSSAVLSLDVAAELSIDL